MVDWAAQQAEAFKAKRANQQQESEKSLSDRKLKERCFLGKWEELRRAVDKKVDDFNIQMREPVLFYALVSDGEFSVTRKDNHATLAFRGGASGPFDLSCWIGMGQILQYSLEIKNGDEVGFKSKSGGFQESEYIAENALTLLLRG
jgi:hypothetical protein